MTEKLPNQLHALSGLKAQLDVLVEAARPIVALVRAQFEQLAPLLLTVAEALKMLPDRTKEALLKLGSHGWYLDPELPAGAIFRLAEIFDTKTKEEADRVLCGWVDSHVSNIEAQLADAYPSRQAILREAFSAHQQKMYAVSTPVFLAQADGICQEMHGVGLYKKHRDGDLVLKRKIQPLEIGHIEKAMLTPLIEVLPIIANTHERPLNSNQLNRHAILHGESLDYGTFENSCRAISLLSYSGWALRALIPGK